MKIKLGEGIYWDTDREEQSNEALDWMSENVTSKLGVDDSDSEFITPELDRYKRPFRWSHKLDDYTIVVEREYIAPGKWAKKCDTIKVIAND